MTDSTRIDGTGTVSIRDIDVPFWRIVMILVKWSIAAIPAMIIVFLLYAVIGAVIGGILLAIGVHMPPLPTIPASPAT